MKPRILAANRRHTAVHYPTVHEAVQAATGQQVSSRTIRRYGKEELGVKSKGTEKKTEEECK
jgi:hypothetical protein